MSVRRLRQRFPRSTSLIAGRITALQEVQKELEEGKEEAVVARLREHVEANLKKESPKIWSWRRVYCGAECRSLGADTWSLVVPVSFIEPFHETILHHNLLKLRQSCSVRTFSRL